MLKNLILVLMLTCCAATLGIAQEKQAAQKKPLVLMGKVEGVNESSKTLTVNHQKVEGYMDAMTMPYKVDQADVLKKVKVGDQIKATVYFNDYTLYDVQVVPAAGKK